MQKIICTQNGISYEFSSRSKYKLLKHSGITESAFAVTTTSIAGQHGEQWRNSWAKKRNPVITAELTSKVFPVERNLLYSFFAPRRTGTLTFIEDGNEKYIDYKVESIYFDESGIYRTFTISLICPDPLFYGKPEIHSTSGMEAGGFTWDLQLPPHPFTLGETAQSTVLEVPNYSSEALGLTLTLRNVNGVRGIVKPVILQLDSNGQEVARFAHRGTIRANGNMVLSTYNGDKNVYFDGIRVNHDMVSGSTFLQVPPGGAWYKAESLETGEIPAGNYIFSIEIKPLFWGA